MTVRLIEGFDMYPTVAGVLGVESRWLTGAVGSLSLVSGRFGGQALRNSGAGSPSTAIKGAAIQEGSAGFAVQFQSVSGLGSLFTLRDEADAVQITVAADSLGRLLVYRGTTSGAFLANTGIAMTVGVWYFLEVEFRIDNPSGFIRLFLNGAELISFSGNTQGVVAANTMGRIGFFSSSGYSATVDDVYVSDTITRLGESRVDVLTPSEDIGVAFIPNVAGNNFSRVNEPLVDGDTSYVRSSTVTAQDLYGLTDMAATPEKIHAVQIRMVARKDDAATRAVATLLKSGAAPVQVGTPLFLSSSYTTRVDIYDTDPNTSAAWQKEAIDVLQIGQRITV